MHFPDTMLIDYVRIYQRDGMTLGCDPEGESYRLPERLTLQTTPRPTTSTRTLTFTTTPTFPSLRSLVSFGLQGPGSD